MLLQELIYQLVASVLKAQRKRTDVQITHTETVQGSHLWLFLKLSVIAETAAEGPLILFRCQHWLSFLHPSKPDGLSAWKCVLTHISLASSQEYLYPTSFASSALTFVPAVTPLDMLWSEQLELKGFLLMRYWRTASVSLLSLSMRVSVISLCCSLEQ